MLMHGAADDLVDLVADRQHAEQRAASTTPMAMPPSDADDEVVGRRCRRSAPAKAPPSSMPSMAMLTTPARSHSTPARAPRASGDRPPDRAVEEPDDVGARRRRSPTRAWRRRTAPWPPASTSGARAGRAAGRRRAMPSDDGDEAEHEAGRAGRHDEVGQASSPRGLRTNVASPTARENRAIGGHADADGRRRRARGPAAAPTRSSDDRRPARRDLLGRVRAGAVMPRPSRSLNCWRRAGAARLHAPDRRHDRRARRRTR